MSKFAMPDQLPATVAELAELANKAKAEINVFQARNEAGEEFSKEDVERLQFLVESHETLIGARDELAAAEQEQADSLNSLLDRATSATAPGAPEKPAGEGESEGDGDGGEAAAEVVAEAESVAEEAAEQAGAVVAAGAGGGGGVAKTAFVVGKSDLPGDVPTGEIPKGFQLLPSAPKFAEMGGEKVGFAEIAEAICSVQAGQRTGRQQTGTRSIGGENFATQAVAKMVRPQNRVVIDDPQQLNAELDRLARELPGHGRVTAQALVAAGGWCAPSEQLYDFCAVPDAQDLMSLPEVTIRRGGIRFPNEPDYTDLLTGFHFTETELQAVDGDGKPTAVKTCAEVPCPDDFTELRLEAIGWCVKAGILQNQAWPEAVQNFLEHFMVAHQKRVSALTVSKMVAYSTSLTLPTDAIIGATSGVLNGLHKKARDLQLRSRKDVVEGVAPSWFRDVIKADLAMRDGLDALAVSDAQIDGWLADRGIYLQYTADWQTNEDGKPGDLTAHTWPGYVDVLLYPAGTFWRSLDNVITLGVQYPLDLVQLNQYSHGFVEDSILVGKRCGDALNARIPLCVNGAIGAREEITCSYSGTSTRTATVTVTGTPTGGTFPLTLGGKTATIDYNATAAAIKTAVVALDDGYVAADFTTTGGALPGTAVVITYPSELGPLTSGTDALTGGTDPAVTIS